MVDSLLTPAVVPDLSDAILSAPGWCRVGIAMPDEAMRHRAASELARAIVERLSTPAHDADQFTLAL
jgi:hypothetical protein